MGDKLSRITNNILNFIASISLLALIYSLFILRKVQSEGYTANIYEQLPFYLYLSLLFCYFAACMLLLSYRKISSVLILFLVHSTVIIIPYMLSYAAADRTQTFLYMGLIQGSELSGFSYLSPTGPLLVSTLSLVSGLEIGTISYLLPVLFSILFITGMYLFYRIFMSREKLVIVSFLVSVIPYFGHFQASISPYYLSFCLVPLYLYILRNVFSAKNKTMTVALIIMLPLLPLAHPFTFTYLLSFSLLLIVSGVILKPGLLRGMLKIDFLPKSPTNNLRKKVPVFIFLSITSAGFLLFAKYTSQVPEFFISTLSLRINLLLNSGFSVIPKTGQGLFEFLHLFNLAYGKYYIPLVFIVINSVIVWQNRKRFCHHFVRRYPRFLVLYIATFFLEIGFLLNPFIPYPPDRFANLSFIIFAQIPLLGYSLYVIFLRKGYTLGLGAAVLVLCLLWSIGFFTCFSSPYSGEISEAVSQNEMQGLQWLSGAKESSFYVRFSEKNVDISSFDTGKLAGSDELQTSADISTQKKAIQSPWPERPSTLATFSENNNNFYFIATTFSEALSQYEQGSNSTSSFNTRTFQESPEIYKIYDSLNIDIYKNNSNRGKISLEF